MSNDLDSLRTLVARATGTGWEAAYRQDVAALVAEVERLRHDVADLQMQREQNIIDNMHAYEEGVAEGERRAVAYLRERANAEHPIERGAPSLSPAGRGLLLLHADAIERGEHRREEE